MKKIEPHLPNIKLVLNTFLDFLVELSATTEEQKKAIDLIRVMDLVQPDKKLIWGASLDIADYMIQSRKTERTGVYWRTWSISYEASNGLEITAKSKTEPEEVETDHFEFDFLYYYQTDEIFGSLDNISEWLNDVSNYKNYITEHLDFVDIDITVHQIGSRKNKKLA